MSKWCKACYLFKEVRSMLNDSVETVDCCVKIMSAIADCCEQIIDNETDWDFYEDFADLKAEIHDEMESIIEDETDYEDCENSINYYLGEFYDLCDIARVWLAI